MKKHLIILFLGFFIIFTTSIVYAEDNDNDLNDNNYSSTSLTHNIPNQDNFC